MHRDQACDQAMQDMKLCIDKLAEGQSETVRSMALLLQAPARTKGFCDCPRVNQEIDIICGLQVLADSNTLSAVDGFFATFDDDRDGDGDDDDGGDNDDENDDGNGDGDDDGEGDDDEEVRGATNELPQIVDELQTIRSDVEGVVDDLNSNDFENAMEDFNMLFEDFESPDSTDFNLTSALEDLTGLFGGDEENAELDAGLEDLGMAFLGIFQAMETCVQPLQDACPEELVKQMGLGEDMFSMDYSYDYSNTDYDDSDQPFGNDMPTEEEFEMLCSKCGHDDMLCMPPSCFPYCLMILGSASLAGQQDEQCLATAYIIHLLSRQRPWASPSC